MLRLVLVPVFFAAVLGQYYDQNTTPRPRIYHPPAQVHYATVGDKLAGDYKFGYDTGKGPAGQSFREEVRLPDGTVKGSYGYLDDQGQQRLVKYTAGAQGFVLDSDAPAGQAAAPQRAPAPRYQPAPQQHQPAPRQYQPAPRQYQPAPQQYEAPAPEYREPPARQYRPAQTRAPQAHYQPAPQQYQAPQTSYTNPTRNPAYNPHHAQYFASIGKPYVPPRQKSNEERRREEESYGPPVIPYDLLSYNIGVGGRSG